MSGVRQDIQSLRAIAVSFVLAFHLWDEQISGGYFGVDVFFIISGYIMCMLLSKASPIDKDKIITFYFRRIKRIVPLYLFLIMIVLFLSLWLVASAEYHFLFWESLLSAIFCSNFIETNENNYFNLRGQFSFFKHTWSLSVEIQFYLIVPILFYLFQWLDTKHKYLKFGVMGFIAGVSFAIQSILTDNSAHMWLVSRLWQFMCGFATYHLHKSGILAVESLFESDEEPKNDKKESIKKIQPLIAETLKLVMLIVLFVGLCMESIYDFRSQLHRLGVVLITMLIMAQKIPSYLLELKPMIALGDCSYSVYLVHWPLFSFHRYWYPEHYDRDHDYPNFIVGIQLIFASIVLGYLMEEMFKFAIKWLRTWVELLSVVFSMYCLMGMLLVFIGRQIPSISHDQELTDLQVVQLENDFLSFYNSNFSNITTNELNDLHIKMHIRDGRRYICQEHEYKLPTNFPNPIPLLTDICMKKGNGTKNVLLIGNSHARAIYFGVKHKLSHIYNKLTLVATRYCLPFYESNMDEILAVRPNLRLCPSCRKFAFQCVDYGRSMIDALNQWKEPIDIIISVFAHHLRINPSFDVKNDAYLQEMQSYFTKLSNIAREVVLIPDIQMYWPIAPTTQHIQQRLHFDRDLELFEVTPNERSKFLDNIKRRSDMIECPKCVRVNWTEAWCRPGENCKMLDSRNLSYFRDTNHVNIYGSMIYGQMLSDILKKLNL